MKTLCETLGPMTKAEALFIRDCCTIIRVTARDLEMTPESLVKELSDGSLSRIIQDAR